MTTSKHQTSSPRGSAKATSRSEAGSGLTSRNRPKHPARAPSPAGTEPRDPDPNADTVIIASEDGFYRLTREEWEQYRIPDENALDIGVLQQLVGYGTMLASLPKVGVEVGFECVLVNLNAILRRDLSNPVTPE